MSVRSWDEHFLNLALCHAAMSKDPSTKVGAVVVGPDREVRSMGYNGFPRGIADTEERLEDRDLRLCLTVHAERNALLAAARIGVPLKGCTLYSAASTQPPQVEGWPRRPLRVWGGICGHCAIEAIQAGIVRFVSYPLEWAPERWLEECVKGGLLLKEAGVIYQETRP